MNLSEQLNGSRDLFEILPQHLDLWEGRLHFEKGKGEKKGDWEKYPRKKLNQWPPNKGTYEIRDPVIPVAFLCPSQNQDLQTKAINWGAGISGPCVTPDRGVELVIANIIANPNIRYLVLGGMDSGHLSGDVLYHLWREGINRETRRVLNTRCPTNPYIRNLPLEAIERFREQVTVLNLLKCPREEILRLVIRSCLQEPEHPVVFKDEKLDTEIELFDRGRFREEPIRLELGLGTERKKFFEGVHRVGTSIHSPSVKEAWSLVRSHVLQKGKMGLQESTRRAKDVVGLQVVIHDPGSDPVPKGWKPHGWTGSKKEVEDWLEAYVVWVYLFPYSDVKLEQETGRVLPYIPEEMDYSYGTRLTAWGIELAPEKEKREVKNLVRTVHQKYKRENRLPSFSEVEAFHEKLKEVQEKSVNSLYRLSEAVNLCVENEITASYRNYVSLQHPALDLEPDLRLAHNPCFCLYEAYPRKIGEGWQLDAAFFLRANDLIAFPANAAAGIGLQDFLAFRAGIESGLYLHHAGCMHIQDYLL